MTRPRRLSRRQWTARAGLAERAAAPAPEPGEHICVQCRWPFTPDEAGNARCGHCGLPQYVLADGGQGRWPDGMEPEQLRAVEPVAKDWRNEEGGE